MDFSFEGLRKQALIMFSTTQTKRMTLPPKRTPEVDKNAEEIKSLAIHGIRSNPIFRTWAKNTFTHNKAHKDDLALIVVVFPQQCIGETLEKLDTLGSQMMLVPLQGLGDINVPDSVQRFKDIARLYVRVELFFTQEEDVKRADICIMDPEARLPPNENDMEVLIKRTQRKTGVPEEIIRAVAREASKDPESAMRSAVSYADIQKAIEFENEMTRVCSVCRKYGITMGKCSRCRKVYYCSKDCQNQDWKTHKGLCKK